MPPSLLNEDRYWCGFALNLILSPIFAAYTANYTGLHVFMYEMNGWITYVKLWVHCVPSGAANQIIQDHVLLENRMPFSTVKQRNTSDHHPILFEHLWTQTTCCGILYAPSACPHEWWWDKKNFLDKPKSLRTTTQATENLLSVKQKDRTYSQTWKTVCSSELRTKCQRC